MIRSLEILDSKNTFLKWLGNVEALSTPRKFEFKPGLNVIWGRNGAGKSTIIRRIKATASEPVSMAYELERP